MIDFTEIKARLEPPVKRETLIEIMSKGLNIPEMVKATAFILVSRMKQPELDKMGELARQAIDIFERDDPQALEQFLADHNIPLPIIKVILQNASHIAKI